MSTPITPENVTTLQGAKIDSPLNVNMLRLVVSGFEAPKGFDLQALLACKTKAEVAKLGIVTAQGYPAVIDRVVLAGNNTGSDPHLFGVIEDPAKGRTSAAWRFDGTEFNNVSRYNLQCGGQVLKEYWVNIRRKSDGSIFIGNTLHADKKTAFKYANQGRTECIATISVRLPAKADVSMLSLEQPA